MKIENFYLWILLLIGAFALSSCYTQLKLEDDEYSQRTERKRVIIEKRVEEKDGRVYEEVDTTYESTDDYGYEEDTYYYPRHRRAYKYYHPGITVVVGGSVFYDPWYFDYFYYPHVVCRTYYLPWWYGYYSCYRVWHGFAYYDPFYNPFYAPPYWWYDPYWYGGYYPPIVQYRKNDYTRLRDQSGERSGSVRTGNWGRDLNLETATERSRLRDVERSATRTSTGRDRNIRLDDELRTPTSRDRDRGTSVDRTTPSRTTEPSRSGRETIRDRQNERQSTPPSDRTRLPDRNPDRGRERIDDRSKEKPERKENTPPRRYEYQNPGLEQKIINERNDNSKSNELPSRRNTDSEIRNSRNDRIRIEYEVPRREYTPRLEERKQDRPSDNRSRNNESVRSNVPTQNSYPSYEQRRNETPSYEQRRSETPRNEQRRDETPRYEPRRIETPRYETPRQSNPPSYNPPSRNTPPPASTPAPIRDRRSDQ